eukprot:gnl/TRDRNA2_/TRDRNA2_151544_c0_seq1.p1 gnl/TRDRNA2_/TRDRNA2_151544_c0~~gnl/TRDRNA2_/TRDRNA2_151544_c0_seq1.p1  ORF type:complete len:829 (+),score=143.06 gnl/TRDRNA2_/TRDRNA2_151544_c0_seq1:314-2488(+)
MLAWALYFAVHVLEEASLFDIAASFKVHLVEMCNWAVRLAYKGGGKVAARIIVPPRGGSSVQSEQNCEDPFAGELFCLFLDLLAEWSDADLKERDTIWADPARRAWLGTAMFDADGGGQPIEVLLHGTFSVHEEWKHLMLPYTAVPACRKLLCNSEKARTAFARAHGLPGMLGDCHVPSEEGDNTTRHVTTFGIPGISGLLDGDAHRDSVAAYGSFGLLLVEPAVGAVWLRETLAAAEDMQTAWGAAESCRADGTAACPLLTWDTKATTALALLGGVSEPMRRYLEADGLWSRFTSILQDLYVDVAGRALCGELTDFSLPISMAGDCNWRSACAHEMPDTDLEMLRAYRGSQVPMARSDAWKLCEVRAWFEAHQTEDESAPYCTGGFEDWCASGEVRYGGCDAEDRLRLYRLVVEMFDRGVPLVVLARQAPSYPLFFDLDLYGGREGEPGADEVHNVAWLDEDKVLLRSIVEGLLQLYPQHRHGLEVGVFCSSGMCRSKGRYKASYHLVFPELIVDRPEKCWPDCPDGAKRSTPARHIIVRDHVLYHLTEAADVAGSSLWALRRDLLRCCRYEVIGGDAPSEHPEELDNLEVTYLNDWTEVLDEKPFWHEPWPEAATGMRLPFTDKAPPCQEQDEEPTTAQVEGRPKIPLGRWRFQKDGEAGDLTMERLPNLDPTEWVRLGDISIGAGNSDGEYHLTPWVEDAIHPDVDRVWEDCPCPLCRAMI